MNYTTNYHLPQWVESDRILMEDFNDAMAGIDQGIQGAKAAAETAQTTADTAEQKAEALADAYTPSNQPFVVGTYVGTGEDTTVTLGFRPKFVVISGMQPGTQSNSTSDWDRYFALCDGNVLSGRVMFTDTGFVARREISGAFYPVLHVEGRTYCYIAFR